MESVIFHLEDEQAFDAEVVESIKRLFKGRRFTVTVTPEATEITNPALLQTLAENEKADYAYRFSAEEFEQFADRVLNDERVDVLAEIERRKVEKP